jgi:hypothetical protein
MKLKYEKTKEDKDKEKFDLENDPILKFIKHQESFKFNIGDILVMYVNRSYDEDKPEWDIKTTSSTTNAPVKYIYAFENELGIGYIKQLKADGSGLTKTLTCVTDLDPANERLDLDPDFADHVLLSNGEEEFEYNRLHKAAIKYRKDAINKNKKLLLDLPTAKDRVDWFLSLKKGDKIWMGYSWYDLVEKQWEITKIANTPKNKITDNYVLRRLKDHEEFKLMDSYRQITAQTRIDDHHYTSEFDVLITKEWKITTSKPWPLKETL